VFGGPHNQALRLCRPLAERGWETSVLLPDEPGDAQLRLRDAGVEVMTLPMTRLRDTVNPITHGRFLVSSCSQIRNMRRVMRKSNIDLVQVSSLANPHAALAARLEGIPVVLQLIDIHLPVPLRHALVRLVGRLANVVMSAGNGLRYFYLGNEASSLPWFAFYPPVDTTLLRPDNRWRTETRRSLRAPIDAPVVGTVANLNPLKGVEYFVQAAGIIAKVLPSCHFVHVGATYDTHRKYAEHIYSLAGDVGFSAERFTFAHARSDIERIYPAFDVNVISSVSESTTTTAMEAMSCGVPVVATDVGVLREVVTNGLTGSIVPPRQPEAIASATLRIIQDVQLRGDLSRAARAEATRRFDVERCADVHARAYREAMRARD
jgi:glycosyltransferase involved in cell wall biosynthesis